MCKYCVKTKKRTIFLPLPSPPVLYLTLPISDFYLQINNNNVLDLQRFQENMLQQIQENLNGIVRKYFEGFVK